MNTCTIAGRIGRDAETRSTQAGDRVTSWTVAVDDGWGDKKKTIWFDCSGWGDRWAKLAPHLTKGSALAVTGKVDLRTWQDKDGGTRANLSLRVFDVTLQGGRQDQQQGGRAAFGEPAGVDADEIPF